MLNRATGLNVQRRGKRIERATACRRAGFCVSRAGQSLVEFALMLPFLVLLLVGVIDLGRIYFSYMTIVNAAREGARYGAAHPPASTAEVCATGTTTDPILRRVLEESAGSGVNTATMTVCRSLPDGNAGNCKTNPGTCYPIRVRVRAPFQLVTGLIFGGANITLETYHDMQVFVGN
jgi:Flp pilus assembly protein TadG